jgi:hypothetical protein
MPYYKNALYRLLKRRYFYCILYTDKNNFSLSHFRKEVAMRKVPFVSVFWFFALALPFTIIALAGVAYVDLHFSQIVQSVGEFGRSITAGGRGVVAETAQRFPEVLGMVIGMIVILTIYLFVRQPAQSVDQHNK